jgi:biopolymer transport protein TolR
MAIKKIGAGLRQGKPVASEINVTPMIDVVLVLLIIFMVLTPVMIYELMIKLPDKTETAEEDDLPKDQLLVAACKDGTITLNRNVIDIEDLSETLERRLKRKPKRKKTVFVDAHPDAGYDRVVELLDVAKDAGAEKLGLASLKTAEDFTACSAPTPESPAEGDSTGGEPAPAP